MRYFAEIAYNGTRFLGWQIQPNGITVQAQCNHALSTVLHTPVYVVGCGRTDTGVHASYYIMHFDYEGTFPENVLVRLNACVGPDVAFRRLAPVAEGAHARFDAYSRSYQYIVSTEKNPFRQETAYYFPFAKQFDIAKAQECAALLLEYKNFITFCKKGGEETSNLCYLTASYWEEDPENKLLKFNITSNRFLRGMVRLVVGATLNVGIGKYELSTVKHALDTKTLIPKAWTAPAQGLFLTDVKYPFEF